MLLEPLNLRLLSHCAPIYWMKTEIGGISILPKLMLNSFADYLNNILYFRLFQISANNEVVKLITEQNKK